MRPIVTDESAWYACLSVCMSVGRSVTIVSPAEMAELIEVSFGMWTRVGPEEPLIRLGSTSLHGKGQFWGERGDPL